MGFSCPNACGLFTSGVTESVNLAVKGHRDASLGALGLLGGGAHQQQDHSSSQQIPHILAAAHGGRVLNVVAGVTMHPTFDKACALPGLVLIKVPVEADTLAFSPHRAAQAMDGGTVLVVASAPGFAHGVVDDVVGLGRVAASHHLTLWRCGCAPARGYLPGGAAAVLHPWGPPL